jgi:hypothetical protein
VNESKLLRLVWEGPLTYREVIGKAANTDYGLYQIYAHHTVFGPNSLVYIGKAEQQTFAVRFTQHWENWLTNEREATIYLGRVWWEDRRQDDEWAEWAQLVSDAEKLLIHWHTPPYNSQFITEYSGRPLHVQCWGDRGRLLPEFSSHRQLLRPDDSVPE